MNLHDVAPEVLEAVAEAIEDQPADPAFDETAVMVAGDVAATLGRALQLYSDNPDAPHREHVLKLLPVLCERLADAGLAALDVYEAGQLALVVAI